MSAASARGLRDDVVQRCGAEPRQGYAPYFDAMEPLDTISYGLRDLFACIDALERRVAELEGKAKPQ